MAESSLDKAQAAFRQGRTDALQNKPARPPLSKFKDSYYQGYETGTQQRKG